MFRALHVTTCFGTNLIKGACGMPTDSLAEMLQKCGGLYSKVTQQSRITDPTNEIYDECKQVNAEETLQRLETYLHRSRFPVQSKRLLGSGSIGVAYLVHTTGGEDFVLKQQYVGIRDLWIDDLKMLEISMKGLCLLQGGSSTMFMQQARHLMETELDYIKEVQTQQWFFENFKDHEFIVTPEVFGHMSTSTVIVSKYIDGESMLDFISHASQDAKNHIANQLFTFHIESFVGCRLYVDYHWGNMKVLDGDKLVMLDFGMCETVTGNVRNEFMVLSNLAIAKDRSGFLEQVKKNGYNVEKVGIEFYDVYEIFGRPRASPDFRYNQAYMDEINTILTGSCVGEMNEGALSVMRAELLLVHVMVYMGAQPNVHALHNKYDLKGCTV